MEGPQGSMSTSMEQGATSQWELAGGALTLTSAGKGSKQQRACKCEIVPYLLLLLICPSHGAGQRELQQS